MKKVLNSWILITPIKTDESYGGFVVGDDISDNKFRLGEVNHCDDDCLVNVGDKVWYEVRNAFDFVDIDSNKYDAITQRYILGVQ